MKMTLTDRIIALRYEAGVHGDTVMVAICDQALCGDKVARYECTEVILAAQNLTDAVEDTPNHKKR